MILEVYSRNHKYIKYIVFIKNKLAVAEATLLNLTELYLSKNMEGLDNVTLLVCSSVANALILILVDNSHPVTVEPFHEICRSSVLVANLSFSDST